MQEDLRNDVFWPSIYFLGDNSIIQKEVYEFWSIVGHLCHNGELPSLFLAGDKYYIRLFVCYVGGSRLFD